MDAKVMPYLPEPEIIKTVDHPNKVLTQVDKLIVQSIGNTVHLSFIRYNTLPENYDHHTDRPRVQQEVMAEGVMATNAWVDMIKKMYQALMEMAIREATIDERVKKAAEQGGESKDDFAPPPI